jgi:hypothetical protein
VSDEPPYEQGERITVGQLYRRIPNLPGFFQHTPPLPRPTSMAFLADSDDEYTSMALVDMTTPAEMLKDHPDFGLCMVEIEHFPDDVVVTYEPKEAVGHVGVWHLDNSKAGVRRRRYLARIAEVVKAPRASTL